MKIRVAKKIHLATQCTGHNCHRWSTIEAAAHVVTKAFMRPMKKRTYVPAKARELIKEYGGANFHLGSRLLDHLAAYQVFTGVCVDWEENGWMTAPPAYSDPHKLFAKWKAQR